MSDLRTTSGSLGTAALLRIAGCSSTTVWRLVNEGVIRPSVVGAGGQLVRGSGTRQTWRPVDVYVVWLLVLVAERTDRLRTRRLQRDVAELVYGYWDDPSVEWIHFDPDGRVTVCAEVSELADVGSGMLIALPDRDAYSELVMSSASWLT